jgi:transcriptional regulator with XRE-family HTH domain
MIHQLGTRVAQARKHAGLTQAQLADQTGVSRNALIWIETGRTQSPSAEHIRNIAVALGVTTDFLVGLGPEFPERSLYGDTHVDLAR